MNDPHVCKHCIDDEGIQEFIVNYAVSKVCSFCGRRRRQPFAAPLDDVIHHINSCLHQHYEDPANSVGHDNEEGGYNIQPDSTEELLSEVLCVDFPGAHGDELRRRICRAISTEFWVQTDPYGLSPDEMHRFSWDEYCRIIKHRWRFFFSGKNTSDDLLGPDGTLETIFEYAENAELFVTEPKGTRFFRARFLAKGASYHRALDLGPPPQDAAIQSNRMSPPGIVMTYVGDDATTALAETANKAGNYKVATFHTERDALLLDFTKIPRPRTIFHELSDAMEYDSRPRMVFLRNVGFEISKPIARDDRVHLEYVPTQVITEYIRTVKSVDGRQIDGIRYASSRNNAGTSVVLFADQDNLILPKADQRDFYSLHKDRWLRMVRSTTRHVTKADLKKWSNKYPHWF